MESASKVAHYLTQSSLDYITCVVIKERLVPGHTEITEVKQFWFHVPHVFEPILLQTFCG